VRKRNILDSMRHFAVSAIGQDRPGIVAAVSEVLLEHQGNIEDSQMTILRGHFTMTLIVSASEGIDESALRAGLERVRDRLRLDALTVNEIAEIDGQGEPKASHIVSVYGIDHPGIVHAVSSTVAHYGASITDLTTRVVDRERDAPLYSMMFELALSEGFDVARLEQRLYQVGVEQEVDVSFRPLERDQL
jgi:glycine cleavage system transcriptional repressor